MTIKVAKTLEGVVIRITRSNGECSYRKNHDGSWVMCSGHKGPWVSLNAIDVPATALRIFAAMVESNEVEMLA